MSETKRCAQCGRTGTRGFTTMPAGEWCGTAYDALTLCTADKACRRRWAPPSTDGGTTP